MICSLEELGIPEDYIPKEYQGGVFIFNRDQNIGMDALAALYLDDQVMDFDLTPNRKDALSMAGAAYETRALFGGEVSRRSEEHTSELQSRFDLVCRLLLAFISHA